MKKGFRTGRRTILAAGAAIQLLTGFPSAWGVFREPVMRDFALDGPSAGFAANCIVAAYGLGCVLGGFLQDRKGPKPAALTGTVLLCGGLLAAGMIPGERAGLFYLAFSLPVGLGCAFLYPAVMGCVQKWYWGRKGLATGVVGLGVGLSGLVLTLLVNAAVPRWGTRGCFFLLAALLLPLCGTGSLLLRDPPGYQAPEQGEGLGPVQMLKTRAFRLAFCSMALATPALLLFSPRIPELAAERGLAPWAAAWIVAAGSFGSAAGRLAAPWAGDRLGQKKTDLVLFSALFGLSVWFAVAEGWTAAACYVLLCLCYAGQMAVMPSLCTRIFGLAHTGVNYGFLALGASLGSLGFPFLARTLGLEQGRHALAALCALGGFWCLTRLNTGEGER